MTESELLNRQSAEWEAEIRRLSDLLATATGGAVVYARADQLAKIATGELLHDNNGLCPDIVEGHDSRDPDCPACQALIAFDLNGEAKP